MYLIYVFTDIPSPINLRTVSKIRVTSFNISWNASNRITCGDVYYEVSISPPPIEQSMESITSVNDTFYFSVTGLNNNIPDVMVTVTASNKAGQGNMSISVTLPKLLGKCYVYITLIMMCTWLCMYIICIPVL